MKPIKFTVLVVFILLLSGCNKQVVILEDNGIDDNVIEVTVTNDEKYHITGEITYYSKDDLSELYLMMFANSHNFGDDRVTVNQLKVNDEEVTFAFEGVDYSALHLDLNQTITSGDIVTIEYDMDVLYPDTFRLAHYGDILYQMYFYPFVAIYNDGFDLVPYAEKGESYTNVITDYDVTITIDNDFIVAAPGDFISSVKKGDMTSYRYLLEQARDFSFSAAKEYSIYEWTENGTDFEIYSVRPLSNSELAEAKTSLTQSVTIYESYLGDYYYDRFILELGYIYGMESSGIIYCSEEISEPTIVHEAVHQWFFFMVGNESYQESFLDETITTFMTSLYYYELYGMSGYNESLDYRDSSQERLSQYWIDYGGQSLLDTTDNMGNGYGFMIYYHGVSIIREYVYSFLDNDVEEFYRMMSVYFNTYSGEIVTIDQFLTFLETESGVTGTKDWFMFHLNELQDVKNLP